MKKHKEAKDAIKALNEFLKKQIELVKQESALRLEVRLIMANTVNVMRNLQEEQSKRDQTVGGYETTLTDLSGLLENHAGMNNR